MHKRAIRKGIIITVIVVVLGLFIFIMTSGGLLKQSFSDNDDVEGYINKLDEAITQEQWNKCAILYVQLEKAWQIVEKRVQFSVERDEILGVSHSLAGLKGSIRVNSIDESIISLEELKNYWKQLER